MTAIEETVRQEFPKATLDVFEGGTQGVMYLSGRSFWVLLKEGSFMVLEWADGRYVSRVRGEIDV